MLKIGEYQRLRIYEESDFGLYLEDSNDPEDVLLPNNYVTDEMKIGDEIDVLVYLDTKERLVATTEKALLTTGQFGYLTVFNTTSIGAFVDWGVQKHLLVPFSNQSHEMIAGQSYCVYMYVDEKTERLIGSTKIDHHLVDDVDGTLQTGAEVSLLVYQRSELGFKVVVNNAFKGLIYNSDIPPHVSIGDTLKGYVKPVRDDGKLDISLSPIGHQSIEPTAAKILEKIKASGGAMPFNDKSKPDEIFKTFGLSKKMFKKSIGNLYRQRLISIGPEGIKLVSE